MEQVFDTPEAAAMFGFPPKYCHVVASRVHGDDAYVLIQTASDGSSYLYGVSCHRRGDGWVEGGSSNGGGWEGPEGGLGTLSFWDDAPPLSDMVRISCEGKTIEVPVTHGAYLAVWFQVPFPRGDWPRVEAFRTNGEWTTSCAS